MLLKALIQRKCGRFDQERIQMELDQNLNKNPDEKLSVYSFKNMNQSKATKLFVYLPYIFFS